MLRNLPVCLKKATEAKYVSETSLHGDWEESLCEEMKVKTWLYWRLQNIGDGKAMGYLQRELLID